MQVLRHGDQLEIVLFQPEVYLLKRSLEDILTNYRADPDNLPDAVKAIWFENGSGMDQEDHEIWVEQLNEFRGENSILAEKLVRSLERVERWPAVLSVSCEEAENLLTVINDQRLYLAAEHEVSELEMAEDWDSILQSPGKHAVMNIHFLAWLIELVIMRLETSEGE